MSATLRTSRVHRRAIAAMRRDAVVERPVPGRGFPFGSQWLWGLAFDDDTCTVYKGGIVHGAVCYYSAASTDVTVGGDEHYIVADFQPSTKAVVIDAASSATLPSNAADHFRFPVAQLRRYGSSEAGYRLVLAWYPVGGAFVNTGVFA